MPAPVLFRTGIPDELDRLDIVFANAFEREEKPGGLSVLLLHAETQTLLAPGDEFALGGRRYRLDAIEAHGSGYRVAVTRLDAPPAPSPTPRRESKEFGIPPIGAHDLGALLRALSPAVLARLAGGAGDPPALEWTRDARETMNTEWNGEQIGPITTSQHAARFPGGEAAVTVEDIRYAPEETYRQEVSGFWRAGEASAHVFLRAEGTAPMTRLHTGPDDGWIADLISAAILHDAGSGV